MPDEKENREFYMSFMPVILGILKFSGMITADNFLNSGEDIG